MTNASARTAIHEGIAHDIRRVSVAHVRITLEVALANWEYFYTQARYTEARVWWNEVHRLMTAK